MINKTNILAAGAKSEYFPKAIILHSNSQSFLEEQAKTLSSALLGIESEKTLELNNDYFEIGNFSDIIKKQAIISLIAELSLSAFHEKNVRTYVIKGFDLITAEAASAFLKFLEESNDNIYGIFLTTRINKILPTLRSRCLLIRLKQTTSPPRSTEWDKLFYEKFIQHNPDISFMFSDLIKLNKSDLKIFLDSIVHKIKLLSVKQEPSKWLYVQSIIALIKKIDEPQRNLKILLNQWLGEVLNIMYGIHK